MLEEVRAVEVDEAVLVAREVRRHPVEDHAHAALRAGDRRGHEVVRRAVSRARREIAGRLVSPRAVERVLGHRHELDMREAHVDRVIGERTGDLAIRQQAIGRCGIAPPRAQVHFVDGHRRGERVGRAAPLHPRLVLPCDSRARQITDAVSGGRSEREGERVGLVGLIVVARRYDAKLVAVAGPCAVGVAFPDARLVAAPMQDVRVAVPSVPVADDRDPPGVGRPYGESRARGVDVRAQPLVQALVGALAKEIGVEVGKHGRPALPWPAPTAWGSWAHACYERRRGGARRAGFIGGYRTVVTDCITRRA